MPLVERIITDIISDNSSGIRNDLAVLRKKSSIIEKDMKECRLRYASGKIDEETFSVASQELGINVNSRLESFVFVSEEQAVFSGSLHHLGSSEGYLRAVPGERGGFSGRRQTLRSAWHRSWQIRQPAPQSILRELCQRARAARFVPVAKKCKSTGILR